MRANTVQQALSRVEMASSAPSGYCYDERLYASKDLSQELFYLLADSDHTHQ